MAASTTIARLIVQIGAQIDEALQGFDAVAAKSQKLGRDMQRVGRTMSKHVTLPVLAAGAGVIKTATDFETSMLKVQALSGSTGDQLEALRDQAKQLGATTQFSASEAADAMGFLAMAGFDAAQIMGALPSTLQLAAAAQMDLAQAADITSNILTGYGMRVEELSAANDVLVKAFTSANTDLAQLGEAMKYAGPVASGLGISFEEAAAAIGMFGNAGIQGSMAGTSLRGALTRLAKPTAEVSRTLEALGIRTHDSSGAMLPLVEIVRQLEASGASAADMMALFGQRAGPAMMALVEQGSEALANFTAELKDSGGTAERIAETQMSGMRGAWDELTSAIEGLAIAIAESGLLEFLTNLANRAARWVSTLSELNPAILKWGTIIATAAAAIGPLLIALGSLLTVLPMIGTAITVLSGPVGWFIGAATLITAAWLKWGDDIKRIVGDTVTAVREWLVGRFEGIVNSVREKIDAVTGFFRGMYEAVVGNSFVPDMIDGIRDQFARLGSVMVGPALDATARLEAGFQRLGDGALNAMVDFAMGSKAAIGDFVESAIRELTRLAIRMAAMRLIAAALAGPTGGASLVGVDALAGLTGFAARGANVRPGEAWVVGERGPELFFPGRSGQVRPVEVRQGAGESAPELGSLMSALASRPRPLTPREAAQDEWWATFVGEAIQVAAKYGYRPV